MSIIRLGVYIEELEDVYREIELKDTNTFWEFHSAIRKAFKLNKKVQSSFFISNARWQKLNEITVGYSSAFEKAIDGEEATIGSIVPAVTKNLVYFNDEISQYTVLVQMEPKADKEDSKKVYPLVAVSKGNINSTFGNIFGEEESGIGEGDLSEEAGFSDVTDQGE